MRPRHRFASILLIVLALDCLKSGAAFGQTATARDYSVLLSASTNDAERTITLHWPREANATGYIVYRREDPSLAFKQYSLDASDTGFTDTHVELGQEYEYKVTKFFTLENKSTSADGIVATGIGLSTLAQRGRISLIIEDSIGDYLASELWRLHTDLVMDGWQVREHRVAKRLLPPEVKAVIKADVDDAPAEMRSVFLIGHVAVPYSGNFAPDDHTTGFGNHEGSWAADAYYGDMQGNWTDNTVNNDSADRAENKNVPDDGHFDQSTIPGRVSLEVGRVDLIHMPAFHLDEAGLLRRYLNRDHAYRTGELVLPKKALVFDSFGVLGANDIPATNGWRNFAPIVGVENITYGPYTDTRKQPYLFSYGCGAGTWFAAAGIGTVWDFASEGTQTLFTMILGSFFGDWDDQDNLLRTPLAAGALTSSWAGRPYWYIHHMGLGQTIGHSTMLTQNYIGYPASLYQHGVHVALMGDPTLRVFYGPTTPKLRSVTKRTDGRIRLRWDAQDPNYGYYVYSANSADGPWAPVAFGPFTGTEVDLPAGLTDTLFMIRATAKVTSPSGTFTDLSPGSYLRLGSELSVGGEDPVNALSYDLASHEIAYISTGSANLRVMDLLGRVVRVWGAESPGTYRFTLLDAPPAVYLVSDGMSTIRIVR